MRKMLSLNYMLHKKTILKTKQENMAAELSACFGGANKNVWLGKHSTLLDTATADNSNPLKLILLLLPPK